MALISRRLRNATDGRFIFWCPGCDGAHQVATGNGSGPRWAYNGNPEAPTFSPSLLIRSGHYVQGQEGKDCWCTFEARTGRRSPFKCTVCHSFITDGRIQFLGDCTHALAGQTVEIPDWPAKHADWHDG